jgi:hypothetical protein
MVAVGAEIAVRARDAATAAFKAQALPLPKSQLRLQMGYAQVYVNGSGAKAGLRNEPTITVVSMANLDASWVLDRIRSGWAFAAPGASLGRRT